MQELTKTEKQARARQSREFKAFREKHLLTQARLAELLGISRRCVIYIERGEVAISVRNVRQFRQLKARYERESKNR
jgi:DNA-binding XRE family transcriptional regulator